MVDNETQMRYVIRADDRIPHYTGRMLADETKQDSRRLMTTFGHQHPLHRSLNPIAMIAMLLFLCAIGVGHAQSNARARDLGIPFDGTIGHFNAITDVKGVEVGNTTLISGEGALKVGVGVGREIPGQKVWDDDVGSIIVVVATDAPLIPTQLKRLAKRVSLGLARDGSYSGNGSGDIFIAFSTANPGAAAFKGIRQLARACYKTRVFRFAIVGVRNFRKFRKKVTISPLLRAAGVTSSVTCCPGAQTLPGGARQSSHGGPTGPTSSALKNKTGGKKEARGLARERINFVLVVGKIGEKKTTNSLDFPADRFATSW